MMLGPPWGGNPHAVCMSQCQSLWAPTSLHPGPACLCASYRPAWLAQQNLIGVAGLRAGCCMAQQAVDANQEITPIYDGLGFTDVSAG